MLQLTHTTLSMQLLDLHDSPDESLQKKSPSLCITPSSMMEMNAGPLPPRSPLSLLPVDCSREQMS